MAKQPPKDTFFTALTGRGVNNNPNDLRGLLETAFGLGPRGGLNTRAAAQALGVSQRTVERWVTTTGQQRHKASAGNLSKLRASARRARTTKKGRAQAMAPKAGDRQARNGAHVTMRGVQGVRDYERERYVEWDIDPAHVEAVRQAYIDGGEAGARQAMEDVWSDAYGAGDWSIARLDDIDLTSR